MKIQSNIKRFVNHVKDNECSSLIITVGRKLTDEEGKCGVDIQRIGNSNIIAKALAKAMQDRASIRDIIENAVTMSQQTL